MSLRIILLLVFFFDSSSACSFNCLSFSSSSRFPSFIAGALGTECGHYFEKGRKGIWSCVVVLCLLLFFVSGTKTTTKIGVSGENSTTRKKRANCDGPFLPKRRQKTLQKTCRELDKLKKELEALQDKCQGCHSKNPGEDQPKIPVLEKGVDSLKRGLTVTMDRLDQFLSHQKKDHARIQEIQQALDITRDELAAWAVHLQQQQQLTTCGIGEGQNEVEEPYQTPTTVLTAMASKGDVKIEVTDPDRYPIGKFIVIQEPLIYLVEGKGSLILERPLCRDFLTGTPVRPLNDTDQYRTDDDGEIYLHNPPQPHSYNEGQGNSTNSHGQNGSVGTPRHFELDGLGGESGSKNAHTRTLFAPCVSLFFACFGPSKWDYPQKWVIWRFGRSGGFEKTRKTLQNKGFQHPRCFSASKNGQTPKKNYKNPPLRTNIR